MHARDLKASDTGMLSSGMSDPYVVIEYPDKTTLKTNVIPKSLNPIWNELLTKEINIEKDVLYLFI